MVVAILQRRHITIPDEKSIDQPVDDDVVGELVNEWQQQHGGTDAQSSYETGHSIVKGQGFEVTEEYAGISGDDC